MKEYIMRYENEVLQLLPDKMQELIRCKDCARRNQHHECKYGYHSDDWFCGDAERRIECMTWGELNQYAKGQLEAGINSIDDWRPASSIMINDLVKVKDDEAWIPYGIRYWLKNGDSIIYVKKQEEST